MKPLIGITMGDPAGVGPELIVKLLKNKSFDFSKFIFFGSSKVLEYEFRKYNLRIPIKNFSTIGSVDTSKEFIVNFEPKKFDFNFEIGKINPNCGRLAYEAILNAIEFANRGLVKAIVTCPINKESLKLASVELIGHTEILSKKSKSNDVFMLMVNDELKVILCTIHVPLLKAVLSLDEKLVLKTIIAANKACYNFGIQSPRIGVAGLNPHAGENGTMGDEEQIFIKPAIQEAINSGLNVSGPISPDIIFSMAREKKFDIVVSLYHDQGLIPFKYFGVGNGVNITIGLPFVRTSPDHGTAFDIAGKGIANPNSFFKAIRYAEKMIN
jgi:4-hydroxythreonine-4-phosphate dehydrogenase